jgi:AcrR family transcriptional regulator
MEGRSMPDGTRRPGARADKGVAIMRAARRVFARDGYSRASIDVIAGAADVSTRTIYNHFESKEQLFATVLETSATEVADGFVARVSTSVEGAPDLESGLVAIGAALAGQATNYSEHFAMVAQISAETPHFPAEVLDAWKEAGPLRVQREIERRLQGFADAGLLELSDPARATHHFVGLVTSELRTGSFYGAPALTDTEMTEIVTAAVRVFLNGYATR